MKTIKNILPIAFAVVIMLFIGTSCDNDSNPAPNDTVCNYQGLTFDDNANNVHTLIPEADLQTDYFPNNDGPGLAAVEVWDTTNPGATFIVTRALTVGAVDNNPEIKINNVNYTGVVTCQRAGSLVGEELRFDVVITGGAEAELCVIIDSVNP